MVMAKLLAKFDPIMAEHLAQVNSNTLSQWSPNFLSRGPCIDYFGPPQAKVRD